jgi:hypothetical protein
MAGRGRIVGSNLGGTSYEKGDGPSVAEVRQARYVCPVGHVTEVPFSAEAEDLPAIWDCLECGAGAVADGLDPDLAQQARVQLESAARGGKPVTKTPWQHLMERRTVPELEAILQERLEMLRGRLRASA